MVSAHGAGGRRVAYLADLGGKAKVATLIDPSVTGAIPRATRKQLVNRDDKSVLIIIKRAVAAKKPDGLNAGVLNGGGLFEAPAPSAPIPSTIG